MTHIPDTLAINASSARAGTGTVFTEAACAPAGVMTRAYAERRRLNAALIHRYRVRGTAVARIVHKFLGNGHVRLVDVGSADGLALIETARQLDGGEFVGVEYSRDLLAMAPQDMPPNVTLVQGDAMRLPEEISDARFDVATALALLEHLPDPVCALKELWRVLRPGGVMIATSPNPFWDSVSTGVRAQCDEHHVVQITLSRLVSLATQAGFERIDSGRFMWAPLAVLPYAKIPVSPKLSLTVDAIVNRIPLLRMLCVNSYVVGRRPA